MKLENLCAGKPYQKCMSLQDNSNEWPSHHQSAVVQYNLKIALIHIFVFWSDMSQLHCAEPWRKKYDIYQKDQKIWDSLVVCIQTKLKLCMCYWGLNFILKQSTTYDKVNSKFNNWAPALWFWGPFKDTHATELSVDCPGLLVNWSLVFMLQAVTYPR